MAFLLRSSKIFATIGFVGKRFISTGRRSLVLEHPKSLNFYELSSPTVLEAEEIKKSPIREGASVNVDKAFYYLNRSIRYGDIFLDEVKDIFEAIKREDKLSDSQLILLLKCCTKVEFMATNQEKILLAKEIWDFAEKHGVSSDISHYNTLLAVFLDNNHNFNPKGFLQTLEEKNIEPDIKTYRLILKTHCQKGDIEAASEVLVKMKTLRYPLNEEDFNSLIQGHCEIGDFAKANELLDVMKSRKINPSSRSYLTLLLGYAKKGKLEEIEKLLDREKNVIIQNSDLLEVIYTLAVNNHGSHIESIKKRLSPEKEFSLGSSRIIQKLLHKKIDSLALEIFEYAISGGLTADAVLFHAKFILHHFVTYRGAKEVLKVCEYFKEKGWSGNALNYVVKKVLLTKDDLTCLTFLQTMRREGLEVRNHYYWPIVINASKKGNPWMRYVLSKMPKFVFNENSQMIQKIIFPNYIFKENPKDDFKFLTNRLGIDNKLLQYCRLEMEIKKGNWEIVERIASSEELRVPNWKHLVNCLVPSQLCQGKDERIFLNTMYCLGHDYVAEKHEKESIGKNVRKLKNGWLFDYSITNLVKSLKDEDLITRVLEGMLTRKMGIHSDTAQFIASAVNSKNIRDLANKLASPEASFQLNQQLVVKKIWKLSEGLFCFISEPAKNLAMKYLNNDASLNEVFQNLKPNMSLADNLFLAMVLAKRGENEASFDVFRKSVDKKPDFDSALWAAETLFTIYVCRLCYWNREKLIEAFDLGKKIGLRDSNLHKTYSVVFSRLNALDAVKLFCEKVAKDKSTDFFIRLLIKAARESNGKAIDQILTTCSDFIPPEQQINYLAIAYATSGQVLKAKEVLNSKSVTLIPKLFYTHCEYYYGSATLKMLEDYLELVKGIENFSRVQLYKLIFRKCADSSNLNKALSLYDVLLEEKVPDYILLKQLSALRANPSVEHLKELAYDVKWEVLPRSNKGFSKSLSLQKEARFIHPIKDAALKGDLDTVLKLIKKHSLHNASIAARFFLEGGYVKECLQLIEHYVSEGNFRGVEKCFNIKHLLTTLENDEVYKKYKTLAIRCLEEGYMTRPLICLFVNSVKIPSRVPAAEALVQQYCAHFRRKSFEEICEEAGFSGDLIKFCENFVANENLKKNFEEQFHVLYNKLISHHCQNGALKDAVNYLNMAVSDKVQKKLDRCIIQMLAAQLEKNGEPFPHPEVLTV